MTFVQNMYSIDSKNQCILNIVYYKIPSHSYSIQVRMSTKLSGDLGKLLFAVHTLHMFVY